MNIRINYVEPKILFFTLDSIDRIIKVDIKHNYALIAYDKVDEMITYNKKLVNKFYNK